MSFGLYYKLGKLVSSLKLGELGKLSFGTLKLGELGEVSDGLGVA